MVIEYEGWRVRPYNALCWQLERFTPAHVGGNGKTVKAGWSPVECYKSSLAGALGEVMGRAAREGADVVALEEAVSRIEEASRQIAAAAREAVRP